MKHRVTRLVILLFTIGTTTLLAGSTELPIVIQYRGIIALPVDFDPEEPVVVLRTEAEYSSFTADLVDPADPLAQQPAIDFAAHMLVAVLRSGSMEAPHIMKALNMLGHAVVQTEYPKHVTVPPEGVGSYAAVVISKSKLKVFIQSTHPDGIPTP